MDDNLERQIYEAIRGQCVSDASAERAAALAVENFKQAPIIASIAEQMEQWSHEDVPVDVSLLRSRIVEWARQLRAL